MMKSSLSLHIILLAGLSGLAFASEIPAPESPPKGIASSDWSSIRAAYEAGRHAAHRQEDGTLTARNPGQQWRTEFDGKGFSVTCALPLRRSLGKSLHPELCRVRANDL